MKTIPVLKNAAVFLYTTSGKIRIAKVIDCKGRACPCPASGQPQGSSLYLWAGQFHDVI